MPASTAVIKKNVVYLTTRDQEDGGFVQVRGRVEGDRLTGEYIIGDRTGSSPFVLQRSDLGRCLDTLLDSAAAGRAYWRVYRQFKMYNDAALNPYLYGGKN